jgi:alpha-galactosidase
MKWFAYCGLVFFTVAFAILLAFARGVRAWDNGVALTPPMGWNSWNKFACNVSAIRTA